MGYQISPLLWQKVQRGLSAGRVQSVAVKIICDREREIRRFEPEEYWTITTDLMAQTPPEFSAALSKIDNKKAVVSNETQAMAIVSDLNTGQFQVDQIKKDSETESPAPVYHQ